MASDDGPRAAVGDPFAGRCDHICLLDDGHVERGELHFYGYELPSPRTRGRAELAAEVRAHLEASIAAEDAQIAKGWYRSCCRAALVDMLAWITDREVARAEPDRTAQNTVAAGGEARVTADPELDAMLAAWETPDFELVTFDEWKRRIMVRARAALDAHRLAAVQEDPRCPCGHLPVLHHNGKCAVSTGCECAQEDPEWLPEELVDPAKRFTEDGTVTFQEDPQPPLKKSDNAANDITVMVNQHQFGNQFHPFTCGNDSATLVAVEAPDGLIMWTCTHCEYYAPIEPSDLARIAAVAAGVVPTPKEADDE